MGVTGTPSFLLAESNPKDPKKVKGLIFIRGAKPYDGFKTDIEKSLGQ